MTVAMHKKGTTVTRQCPAGWTDKQFEIYCIAMYLHWQLTLTAERKDPQHCASKYKTKCKCGNGQPRPAKKAAARYKDEKIKLLRDAAELSKRFHAECGEELERRLDAMPKTGKHAWCAPNPRWALLKGWLEKSTGPALSTEEQAYSWVHQMMEASDEELEKIEIGDADNELCACHGNDELYWPGQQPWRRWCEKGTEWEWYEGELYALALER